MFTNDRYWHIQALGTSMDMVVTPVSLYSLEDVGRSWRKTIKDMGRDLETVSVSPKHIAPQYAGDRAKE
jgi:hypothetical protein